VTYTVVLGADSLQTSLRVDNTGLNLLSVALPEIIDSVGLLKVEKIEIFLVCLDKFY